MDAGGSLPFAQEMGGDRADARETESEVWTGRTENGGQVARTGGEVGLGAKKVLLFWQAKDDRTLLLRQTVRSGQRISWDGNVVVLGDVNPGAELVARGDILVLGTFRGMAHAGAMGNRKAVIAAYRLLPIQLRIAEYISRPPDGDYPFPVCPEMAKVRGGMVVIERLGNKAWFNLIGQQPGPPQKNGEHTRRSEDWAR